MRDLRQYWQEVRALERSLPDFVWLASLEDAKRGMVGGRIAQVGAAPAAQLLYSKSHRMATDDEISAHLAKEEEARRRSFQEGLRQRGIAIVAVPAATAEPPAEDGKRARSRRR